MTHYVHSTFKAKDKASFDLMKDTLIEDGKITFRHLMPTPEKFHYDTHEQNGNGLNQLNVKHLFISTDLLNSVIGTRFTNNYLSIISKLKEIEDVPFERINKLFKHYKGESLEFLSEERARDIREIAKDRLRYGAARRREWERDNWFTGGKDIEYTIDDDEMTIKLTTYKDFPIPILAKLNNLGCNFFHSFS